MEEQDISKESLCPGPVAFSQPSVLTLRYVTLRHCLTSAAKWQDVLTASVNRKQEGGNRPAQ